MDVVTEPLKFVESLQNEDLDILNSEYKTLLPLERIQRFYKDFSQQKILLSSSFGTTSALLLKLISEVNPQQEIIFIDTGFLFPETLTYRDYVSDLYQLKVKNIRPEEKKIEFIERNRLWENNPELYTYLNKIEPFDNVKKSYDIWISGVMSWQTSHRSEMQLFEKKDDILKFHPFIDITEQEKDAYFTALHLPYHPLQSRGYDSVGCVHSTVPGKGRTGRTDLNEKKECGLHL